MNKQLRVYRQAVREAIADAWAAGLPAYQGRRGYLVALYPDGREVRLKKLQGWKHDGQGSTAKAIVARRAERRR
jgi:hypothetical protein